MGCAASKRCDELREEGRALRAKIRALEGEVREARRERDGEARARGRREAAFAAAQVELSRERRRQREEVGALRKRLGEEEARRRALEEEHYCSAASSAAAASVTAAADKKEEEGVLPAAGAWGLVERMKAEQAQREQAVEKWKQLYLAIKAELDALILRTKQGERLCWMSEENVVRQLHIELKAREEMIQALRSRLEAREAEGAKREREVDILRQSLRILGGRKIIRGRGRKNLAIRSWRWRAERRGLQPAQVTCASLRV